MNDNNPLWTLFFITLSAFTSWATVKLYYRPELIPFYRWWWNWERARRDRRRDERYAEDDRRWHEDAARARASVKRAAIERELAAEAEAHRVPVYGGTL